MPSEIIASVLADNRKRFLKTINFIVVTGIHKMKFLASIFFVLREKNLLRNKLNTRSKILVILELIRVNWSFGFNFSGSRISVQEN